MFPDSHRERTIKTTPIKNSPRLQFYYLKTYFLPYFLPHTRFFNTNILKHPCKSMIFKRLFI